MSNRDVRQTEVEELFILAFTGDTQILMITPKILLSFMLNYRRIYLESPWTIKIKKSNSNIFSTMG